MLDKLAAVEARYSQIEARLAAPETYDDPAQVARLNKEQNELSPVVETYRAYLRAREREQEAGALLSDPELRELNMGDWEDQTWGQVRRTQPGELDRFNRSDPTWTAPRGEGLGELGERVERALRRIAAAHPDQTVAVFSHGTRRRSGTACATVTTPPSPA